MFRSINLVLMAVAVAAIAGGCGSHGERSGASGRADAQLTRLAARDDAHHSAARQATDAGALHDETRRYAADMDSLTAEMMAACGEMMSGMMGGMMGHRADAMRAMLDSMSSAVHAHHGRMDSLETLEGMRIECEEHHRAMDGMLAGLRGVSGGMM